MKNWIGEQCSEIEENPRKNNSKRAYQLVKDLTTVKQGKSTTIQDRSGKFLREEQQILNRWTKYCSELYNHKASGDSSVLNCLQTDTEDDHPILCKEVETAVQSWKKGKSAGVDSIPAELAQAGGEDVITAFTTIYNKIWQTFCIDHQISSKLYRTVQCLSFTIPFTCIIEIEGLRSYKQETFHQVYNLILKTRAHTA